SVDLARRAISRQRVHLYHLHHVLERPGFAGPCPGFARCRMVQRRRSGRRRLPHLRHASHAPHPIPRPGRLNGRREPTAFCDKSGSRFYRSKTYDLVRAPLPDWRWYVCFLHDRGDPLDYLRVVGRHVVLFRRIGYHVVKLYLTIVHGNPNPVPLSHSDRLPGVPFVNLPIQVIVPSLVGLLPPQNRHKADPVVRGNLSVCQLGQRGQDVGEVTHVLGNNTLSDHTGAPYDHRHPNTAVVEVTFDPSERAIGVEEIRIAPAFLVRSIVRREEDDCSFGYTELVQLVDDPPNVSIHPADHRGKAFLLLRPGFAFIRAEIRHLHPFIAGLVVCVRDSQREVQKEWTFSVLLDEVQCFLSEQIVAILRLFNRYT